MKILFYLIRYPGVGGIETVTSLVAGALALKGESVSILSFLGGGEASEVVPAGAGFGPGSSSGFGSDPESGPDSRAIRLFTMPDREERLWLSKRNRAYAEKIVREGLFDAIIFQDSYAPIESIICSLAQKYAVPLYVFEHNTPLRVLKDLTFRPVLSLDGLKRRAVLPKWLVKDIVRKRRLYKCCHKYVLLSRSFIPDFCRLARIGARQRDKLAYLNNPVAPLRRSVDIKAKEKIVLCVCQMADRKRVDLMLSMWKDVYPAHPDYRLVLVGDGSELEALKSYARKLALQGCEFVGYADPSEYYRRSRVFWMTSAFEGWGMTLVESMQAGCVPVVYDTFSSLGDIVDDGINGFAVKDLDRKDFIRKTTGLMEEEQLFERMSSEARLKADSFSLDTIISRWRQLLEQ